MKAQARAAFPNEVEMYLFGTAKAGEIEVMGLYAPSGEDVIKSTPTTVQLSGQSQLAAKQAAKLLGLKLLGTVHTHPDQVVESDADFDYYTCAAPSVQDYEGSWEPHILGILHIERSLKGRWSYDLRFYNPRALYGTTIKTS